MITTYLVETTICTTFYFYPSFRILYIPPTSSSSIVDRNLCATSVAHRNGNGELVIDGRTKDIACRGGTKMTGKILVKLRRASFYAPEYRDISISRRILQLSAFVKYSANRCHCASYQDDYCPPSIPPAKHIGYRQYGFPLIFVDFWIRLH